MSIVGTLIASTVKYDRLNANSAILRTLSSRVGKNAAAATTIKKTSRPDFEAPTPDSHECFLRTAAASNVSAARGSSA